MGFAEWPGQACRPRLPGSGWLGRTFAAYGLGNFLWRERSYRTATGVLELALRPHAPLTTRLTPRDGIRHRPAHRRPRQAAARQAAARQAAARYASLRTCAELAPRPS